MANDVVFKTKAFGGFNKDEVMDFVGRILAEKSELEKHLAESNAKCARMGAELQSSKNAEIALASLNERVKELENTVEALRSENEEKDRAIASLNEQLENSHADEEAVAQVEALQTEVAYLKSECEKKRDIERQVGAAMLDARVHSEELVEAAKERANTVTKSVYAAIGDTALKIDDLSTGIGEIARSFTKSVEEVELRIKALTGDMSKTAQLLISESGVITESKDNAIKEVEYDFLTDAGDEI